MEFFDKIQPLLTDLGISIYTMGMRPNHVQNLLTILTNLAPLLGRIRSLFSLYESDFAVVKEQLFRENEKLAKLKKLQISFTRNTGFCTFKNFAIVFNT